MIPQAPIARVIFWMFAYLGILSIYSVASYGLTDPNLVLSTFAPYWQFQQSIWGALYGNTAALGIGFASIVLGLFATYWQLYRSFVALPQQHALNSDAILNWRLLAFCLLCVAPVFVSYNALSHDVFNYMFNARMVVEYTANPHLSTALDFPSDEWTRFMHNTHTVAPYGYGWTALSVVVYLLGSGVFILTWLGFRALALLSWIGLFFVVRWLHKLISGHQLDAAGTMVLLLNPLVVLEVIGMMHNDLVMLVPALGAVGLLLYVQQNEGDRRQQLLLRFAALALFAFSVSIKLVTIVLVPLILWLLLHDWLFEQYVITRLNGAKKMMRPIARMMYKMLVNQVRLILPTLAVLVLFVPLLTARSQQFHPWYLLWPLSWLPLLHRRSESGLFSLGLLEHFGRYNQIIFEVLLLFSCTSLLRYVPFLLGGEHSAETLMQQQLVTWVVPVVWLALRLFSRKKEGVSDARTTTLRA